MKFKRNFKSGLYSAVERMIVILPGYLSSTLDFGNAGMYCVCINLRERRDVC